MKRLLCCLLLLVSAWAHAVIETYDFSSEALERRYRDLSAELRCPKCQNQNIADSNAPIAQDLRKLLYQQLESGASDAQIKEFMVSRYGEFVLYKPQFSGATLILWLAPVGLLLMAIVVALLLIRKREKTEGAAPEMSASDRVRLGELLDGREHKE